MSNTIFITANWITGALSQQTISMQYDNNRYAVQFIGYPEGDGTEELDLYLLVWMSTAPGQKPGEITPIQLNSDQWYISNYFTQQVQVIKFQLCVLNEAGTYEAHSPIFSGRIGDSLEHNGTSHDIDVSTLFDAYREYLNELIIRAGAVIIDPAPTQGSTNAVSSGGVWSALAEITEDTDALTDKIDAVVTTESSSEVVNVDMSGLQRVTGKKINTNNDLIDASAGYSVVWVQVPFTGNITAVSSKTSQYVARIYNNVTDSTDITHTNFAQILQKTDQFDTNVGDTKVGTVTAGQYLVCQAWDDAYTISATVETENGESYTLKQDIGLTNQMESEVDAKIDASVSGGISSAINLANETLYANNGWKTLPADDFELGGWTSYTGKDSRKFRVRYTKTLSFDRDICILADAGFYAEIIKSDGTDQGANTTISVPANTEFKIFARRINEDSSETADITTFANALKISTPLTDMERYADTFTDLSMFPRIGICGDSYAAGGGIISGIRPLTWGKNLERQIGSTVDIYAKSGESIVGWNSDATNGLPALLSGEECGLYWMAHGINGTGSDASIGTSEDMSTTPHPETFYGQYVEAIEQIKTAFPDAKIILQTITGTSYGLYQASQYTKVNTAIRAIAEYCGVPVIDVADDDLYKSTWYAHSMRSNHPTAMLNAGIAHANRRLFAKCVLNNPDYFVNYGNRYD